MPGERKQMKVVSINGEQTVGPREIALNTDMDLTPELLGRVVYGTLKITGEGRVLKVKTAKDDDEQFNSATVHNLNNKLGVAELELKEEAEKRQRMLRALSANIGLPLA